jgi:hypothetical protein
MREESSESGSAAKQGSEQRTFPGRLAALTRDLPICPVSGHSAFTNRDMQNVPFCCALAGRGAPAPTVPAEDGHRADQHHEVGRQVHDVLRMGAEMEDADLHERGYHDNDDQPGGGLKVGDHVRRPALGDHEQDRQAEREVEHAQRAEGERGQRLREVPGVQGRLVWDHIHPEAHGIGR